MDISTKEKKNKWNSLLKRSKCRTELKHTLWDFFAVLHAAAGGYCQTNVCTKQFSILRVFFFFLPTLNIKYIGWCFNISRVVYECVCSSSQNIKKVNFIRFFSVYCTTKKRRQGNSNKNWCVPFTHDVYYYGFCVVLLVYTTDFVHFTQWHGDFQHVIVRQENYKHKKRDHR